MWAMYYSKNRKIIKNNAGNVYSFLGGTQSGGHEKPLEESMRTYETTKPIIQRSISNITDKLMERSKNGHGTFIGSIENSNSFQEEF